MSPREIMNDPEAKETSIEQDIERMPEIPSALVDEDELVLRNKIATDDADSKNDYANAFPDWDLLPPQVEIRRVSHRQS